MTKAIKGSDGKFRGSIGDGKAKVPTAGAPSTPSVPAQAAPAAEGYGAQYSRLQAAREDVAARQVAAAVNPGMLKPRPKPVAKPAQAEPVTPGGYTMSRHLVEQARRKGIAMADLVACIDDPSTRYESFRHPGQVKHIRGDLCVAVDPADMRAITVFLDRVETELRQDQRRDQDALAWERRRRSQAS